MSPCATQTSLAQFVELYQGAIDAAERAVVPAKRVNNILDTLTHSIYLYIQVWRCGRVPPRLLSWAACLPACLLAFLPARLPACLPCAA